MIKKAHCFFEQSGTFKNEFIKLGIPAEDYDIQNNFGETDHIKDLFADIETAYDKATKRQSDKATKRQSDKAYTVFDSMSSDDLIVAFFPCIYFETMQMPYYDLTCINNRNKSACGKITDAIERLDKRTYFHKLLYKLMFLAHYYKFMLIIENPATKPCYLIGTQNFPKPTIIDMNRMLRGDYFVKPTAYWFVNLIPTRGFTHQEDKEQKIIEKCKSGIKAGICSEEKSMISHDYARNFICDFILGKKQPDIDLQYELF